MPRPILHTTTGALTALLAVLSVFPLGRLDRKPLEESHLRQFQQGVTQPAEDRSQPSSQPSTAERLSRLSPRTDAPSHATPNAAPHMAWLAAQQTLPAEAPHRPHSKVSAGWAIPFRPIDQRVPNAP